MKLLSYTPASFIVAAVMAVASVTPASADDVLVVDPISGETVSVTDIAFSTLTEEQRADVGDQLAEQGYRVRADRPAREVPEELAEVIVVDPTSGESIALGEIDIASLSREDRRAIGEQLEEQGYSRPSRGGDREELADVSVVDPTSGETVSLSEIDVSSLSDEDRQAVGDQLAEQGVNPGHGGRGDRGGRGRN